MERNSVQQQRGKEGEKGGGDPESEEEEWKRTAGEMGNQGSIPQYANVGISHFTMEVVMIRTQIPAISVSERCMHTNKGKCGHNPHALTQKAVPMLVRGFRL